MDGPISSFVNGDEKLTEIDFNKRMLAVIRQPLWIVPNV